MKTFANKISMRQLYVIFFIGICSPLVRLLPIQMSKTAKGAVWIIPFIMFLAFFLIIYIINLIFKNNKDKGLADIIESVFGKVLGKILLVVYATVFIILTGIYVRYVGERLLSSIYIYTPIQFFSAVILMVSFFVVKDSIENLGRLSEVFFYIFGAIMLIIFLFSLRNINIYNFSLPGTVTASNSLKSIPLILGLLGYLVYAMFMGDHVTHKETIKKHGIRTGIVIGIVSMIIIVVTVGIFGYNLTEKLNLPFFSAIKNIEMFQTIERTESIFIALWMVTDFVLITSFIFITCNIIKHITKIKDVKYISTPIIFIIYFISLVIASNSFQLEKLSETLMLWTNFTLGFIVPIIIVIVGKMRKVI